MTDQTHVHAPETDWTPERKVVAGAIAALLVFVSRLVFPEVEIPPGVEGAAAIIVAYWVPNKR